MAKESQNKEWKRAWRDDVKWICGFANADGGVLVIGRNDRGEAVGVADAAKLLEDIPNKVRDILGIIMDVNLLLERGEELLEIRVESYPSPVNYKGEYFYRRGSTNQMLKGAALDRFLLRKHGRTWDGSPLPGLSPTDVSFASPGPHRGVLERSGQGDAGLERAEKLVARQRGGI